MGIVFCFLINGKMGGQGRYQASTLELNFVNDVELMLQQIQKALEMSDKVVSKLESVKDDEVQCDQISKAFNTKLRVFVSDLDAKRENLSFYEKLKSRICL